MGNLQNLVEFHVGSNLLMGTIPESIFNISSLARIGAEENNL